MEERYLPWGHMYVPLGSNIRRYNLPLILYLLFQRRPLRVGGCVGE